MSFPHLLCFLSHACRDSHGHQVAGNDGIPSDTTLSLDNSGDATSTVKGYTGSQLDDTSYLNAGASYTGYLQDFGPQGSETMPLYSWNSRYDGDATNGINSLSRRVNPELHSNASMKTKGLNNPIKANTTFDSRPSNFPLNMKARRYTATPNTSHSLAPTQPLKSLNQLGSSCRSAGVVKGFQPAGKLSYTTRNQGPYFAHDTPLNYRSNARMWNGSDRFGLREKSNMHGEFEAMNELTRGPRGQRKSSPSNPPAGDKQMGLSTQQELYNLEDFQIKYDNAKFYVIKSYSEDDIHKCIKYAVWSSTPNGNKKLDSAFHGTEGKTSEAGPECPIFLFYSVNGSGQFVGLAQMIGAVDFGKNMDFWQRDKWNGFFPVKWHIVKDIPNTQLRHIIIENNENKPVTHSRDTQEIGLQQGLEMLKIFKSYSTNTSIVDDFNFYEKREQTLKARRSNKPAPQTDTYWKHEFPKHKKTGERTTEGSNATDNLADPSSSLIRLTRNLSLNPTTIEGSTIMN